MNEGSTIEIGMSAPVLPASPEPSVSQPPVAEVTEEKLAQSFSFETNVPFVVSPEQEDTEGAVPAVVKQTKETAENELGEQKVEDIMEELEDLMDNPKKDEQENIMEMEENEKDPEAMKIEDDKAPKSDGEKEQLATEKNKETKPKVKLTINKLAELARTMVIIVSIFKLLFNNKNHTYKYSGKDLGLDTEPPEGSATIETEEKLGLKEKSWEQVVRETESIEETTFSDLMSRALNANRKAVPYKIDSDEQEEPEKKKLKKPSAITSGRVKRRIARMVAPISFRQK